VNFNSEITDKWDRAAARRCRVAATCHADSVALSHYQDRAPRVPTASPRIPRPPVPAPRARRRPDSARPDRHGPKPRHRRLHAPVPSRRRLAEQRRCRATRRRAMPPRARAVRRAPHAPRRPRTKFCWKCLNLLYSIKIL
jgi:hypothetical protein